MSDFLNTRARSQLALARALSKHTPLNLEEAGIWLLHLDGVRVELRTDTLNIARLIMVTFNDPSRGLALIDHIARETR